MPAPAGGEKKEKQKSGRGQNAMTDDVETARRSTEKLF